MNNIIKAWFKGGKTNTAMIIMIAVYALNKYFDVQISEAEIAGQVAVVVGVIGQLHKVWKSGTIQKIFKGVKSGKN